MDFGITAINLRGNADETVRLADLRVLKRCSLPLRGTYFGGYTQGGGETVKMGLDLDAPDPRAQAMAITSGRGLFSLGVPYFADRTIELAPGEVETLSIGAFTKRYACEFRM